MSEVYWPCRIRLINVVTDGRMDGRTDNNLKATCRPAPLRSGKNLRRKAKLSTKNRKTLFFCCFFRAVCDDVTFGHMALNVPFSENKNKTCHGTAPSVTIDFKGHLKIVYSYIQIYRNLFIIRANMMMMVIYKYR